MLIAQRGPSPRVLGDDTQPARAAVLSAIRKLQALGQTILEVGDALGLETGEP